MIGRNRVRAAVLALLLMGALRAEGLPFPAAPPAQDTPSEADVKAAILVHFARYTEWPDSVFTANPDQFRVGVLGPEAALEPVQKALKGKKIGGRTPTIVHGKTPGDLKTCAMVFVTDAEKDQIPALLKEFKSLPILTVGETEGFGKTGGILNFYKEDNKVKFGINPKALTRSGLKATRLITAAPTQWTEE